MQERRRFVRLDARLPVSYRVMPLSTSHQTVTLNLGGGGLRLVVHQWLPPGTHVHLDLKLPEQEQSLACVGEVVWCEQAQLYSSAPHGSAAVQQTILAELKFVQMDLEDQQTILRYIAHYLQSYPSP